MPHINLFFVLLDPKRVPQRIISGDLGREEEEWTLEKLLSDTDDYARTFTRVNDKVARRAITKEYTFDTASHTILGNGWVELAIEATSLSEALSFIPSI